MIDVRLLRTELDEVRAALASKGVDPAEVDRAADLDERHRSIVATRDDLRGRRNAISKKVGAAFKAGDRDTGERLRGESKALEDEESTAEGQAAELAEELRTVLL
ncbi:MAG: serine--tRNA ligase, partial [Acidimicrobiales bacterium]